MSERTCTPCEERENMTEAATLTAAPSHLKADVWQQFGYKKC